VSQPDLDALICDHLARQREGVDSAEVLAGVKSRLGAAAVPARNKGRRRLGWGLAAAAALLVALFGGRNVAPRAQASPESLVRDARAAHALPIDRCYVVEIAPDPEGPLMRHPLLAQTRRVRLWTRGDHFWIESTNPNRPWAWGRDPQGAVWVAAGRERGVRFEPAEVPEELGIVCDVCGMQTETLLDELLAGFELRLEADAAPGVLRIRAQPRRPAPGLREVVLDVDEDTHVLRRLELHRLRGGRPLATVTCTLTDSRPQADGLYQLEGHLDAGAPVLDRTHRPRQRALVLWRYFGVPLIRNVP
jgi:hypothetical protein